ncbi:hypothetical protein FIBSPDRAFT_509897 [Athelia psychrophila]|uniref:Uncharacterized protein n=1 Tax=Athelia psychrophila TaxID=1759441 RepID=A0A166JZD7_9AGAM|nr:hypothetical protein FIBSPDRAFT_509897 [Fibularhizoctonia sp. CBS 109695]
MHITLSSSNSGSLKSFPAAIWPLIHSRRSSPSIPLHSAFNHHHAHSPQFAGAGYMPKVRYAYGLSFDTFENPNSISSYMFSYTLPVQSASDACTRATRVFLVQRPTTNPARRPWAGRSMHWQGTATNLLFCGVLTVENGMFYICFTQAPRTVYRGKTCKTHVHRILKHARVRGTHYQ